MSYNRFPPIPPAELSDEQKILHEKTVEFCEKAHGDQFTWRSPTTSALLGPFAPYLYHPISVATGFQSMGAGIHELAQLGNLSATARETAILTVGAHFGASFEQYAHERKAWSIGCLTKAQTEAIRRGEKPMADAGVTDEEGEKDMSIAWDVANALCAKKGPLEERLWQEAVVVLGRQGVMALVQYVGMYMYVSTFLNACAVPVPDHASTVMP